MYRFDGLMGRFFILYDASMPSLLAKRAILSLVIVVGLSSFLPGIARAEAIDATATTNDVSETIPLLDNGTASIQPITETHNEGASPSDAPSETVSTEAETTATEDTTTEENVVTEDEEEQATEAEHDFTNVVQQTTDYTCGPAALATLILLKGGQASEMDLTTAAGTTEEKGTSMLGLKKAAEAFGYTAKTKKWKLATLETASLPVIIHDTKADQSAHYTVVKSFSNDSVSLADTEVGNIEVSLDDFARVYTGQVLTIEPKTTITNGMSLEALTNVADANPNLGIVAFDNSGHQLSLDDLSDEEADAINGRGGITTVAIPMSQLPMTLTLLLRAAGVSGSVITVLVTSTGEIVGFVAMVGVSAWIISKLFDAIDDLVAKAVRQLFGNKTSGSTGGSGSSQTPKLPPNISKIITGAGLTASQHAAQQLSEHPDRLEAYEKIGDVMRYGKLYYDVTSDAFVRVYQRFVVIYSTKGGTLVTAYKAAADYISRKIENGAWIIK